MQQAVLVQVLVMVLLAGAVTVPGRRRGWLELAPVHAVLDGWQHAASVTVTPAARMQPVEAAKLFPASAESSVRVLSQLFTGSCASQPLIVFPFEIVAGVEAFESTRVFRARMD